MNEPFLEKKRKPIIMPPKKRVEINFEYTNIGRIDLLNAKFNAELIIESRWTLDNSNDNYDPKVDWNPGLYIENAHSDLVQNISYQVIEDNGRKYVMELRNVKGSFWQKPNFENFPLDIQKLNVILTTELNSKGIFLVHHPKNKSFINLNAIYSFKDQQRWRLFKLVTTMETIPFDKKDKKRRKYLYLISQRESKLVSPSLTSNIYIARYPGFYLINAYFFIFLINLIAFTIFSIKFYQPHFRLATSFTILLTSISFKWVVNRSLPAISRLNSLDIYHLTSICFICSLTIWHALASTFIFNKFTNEQMAVYDIYAFNCFLIAFLMKHFVYICLLINGHKKRIQLARKEKEFLSSYRSHIKNSINLINMNFFDEHDCVNEELKSILDSEKDPYIQLV